MFHPLFRVRTGGAPVSQILHEAGIMRGKPPELGPRHPGFPQETFNPVDQHPSLFLANRRCIRFYILGEILLF
jgi:hypothetical protein